MTKTTNDLETVKAMLVDALCGAYVEKGPLLEAELKGSTLEVGGWDETIRLDADKLAATVLEFFAGREADLISEMRSERDDLADELDNVRSAFRDRWAAFGSKGGE